MHSECQGRMLKCSLFEKKLAHGCIVKKNNFFSKIRDVLNPNGNVGLQLITIDDKIYDVYKKNPDFIWHRNCKAITKFYLLNGSLTCHFLLH